MFAIGTFAVRWITLALVGVIPHPMIASAGGVIRHIQNASGFFCRVRVRTVWDKGIKEDRIARRCRTRNIFNAGQFIFQRFPLWSQQPLLVLPRRNFQASVFRSGGIDAQ